MHESKLLVEIEVRSQKSEVRSQETKFLPRKIYLCKRSIQEDTESIGEVLADVYFAANEDLKQDAELRKRVIERIAIAPCSTIKQILERFHQNEVVNIANRSLGKIKSKISLSYAHKYLKENYEGIDFYLITKKLKNWRNLNPSQLSELVHLFHRYADNAMILEENLSSEMYMSSAPNFQSMDEYNTQAEIAFVAIVSKISNHDKNFTINTIKKVEFILVFFLRILNLSVSRSKKYNNILLIS